MDQILIKGIKLNVIIGAFHWERHVEQPIELDLILYTDIQKAVQSDDLLDTVDYKAVVENIKQYLQQHQFHLLETAAENISNLIFNTYSGVKAIEITLLKPLALYKENVSNVGVKIYRERR